MKIINKKNTYLLLVFVIGLLFITINKTYAKFPSSYTTADNIVGLTLDFNIGISNIEEYQRLKIEAGEVKRFNVEVLNSNTSNMAYGVWYRVVDSSNEDNVKVGKVKGSSTLTSGTISNGNKVTVELIIKNNSTDTISVDIGVGSSSKTINDIEYLNGKKLIIKELNDLVNISSVEPGSYVKYVGNNGCDGKACEGQNANYVSDTDMGYCYNSSEKFTVNGWRIAYIADGTAYLVSAGALECLSTLPGDGLLGRENGWYIPTSSNYYYGSGYSFNSSSGLYTLTGATSSTLSWKDNHNSIVSNTPYTCMNTNSASQGCYQLYKVNSYISDTQGLGDTHSGGEKEVGVPTHLANLNNSALKYCNNTYVFGGICNSSSVWNINATDFEKITGKVLSNTSCYGSSQDTSCGYGNDLIDMGGVYWFATPGNSAYASTKYGAFFWRPRDRLVISSFDTNFRVGVRPIIRLKSSVVVTDGSGTYEDPYTISVIKEGDIYNVSFNVNGATSGSIDNIVCTFGDNCAIPANTLTKTGYTFLGWTTNSDGTDDGYDWTNWSGTWNFRNDQRGIRNNKLVLYAIWGRSLAGVSSIGSYVKYVGNNGCDGKACEGQNANYVSDDDMGYCYYSSRKFTVNGWRIAYISDGTAYLVSAGAPECINTLTGDGSLREGASWGITLSSNYYYGSGYNYNTSTGVYTLTGATSSALSWKDNHDSIVSNTPYTCLSTSSAGQGCYEMRKVNSYKSDTQGIGDIRIGGEKEVGVPTHLANLNNSALKYCNSTYAYGGACNSSSAWNMNANDFEKITGKALSSSSCYISGKDTSCGYGNDLIDNGGYYWFATPYSTTFNNNTTAYGIFLYHPSTTQVSSNNSYYPCGGRPVLRLKSSVMAVGGTGTYTDPYKISLS